MNTVKIRDFEVGAGNPLALFAGPCVLEGLERSLYIGREIKDIANRLMTESGKVMDLHYKEYFGRLPWRGHTKYVVDSIVSIKEKYTTIDEQNNEILSTIAPGTEGADTVIPGLY